MWGVVLPKVPVFSRVGHGYGIGIPASVMIWRHRTGQVEGWKEPLLMGILNVTPDSFSDSGEFFGPEQAVPRALRMLEEGAALIDVGGESTRPGAQPVEVGEETRRVLPVIQGILQERPDALISIDTYKAEVARRACEAGVSIINDVGGGLWDPEMPTVVAETGAGYVCMHSRGRPDMMQNDPQYGDVVGEILIYLLERRAALRSAGVPDDCMVFDVGIGFGKTVEHNMELVRRARDFHQLQRPVLWGLSRKSFLFRALGRTAEFSRLGASLACKECLLRAGGPQIWRVHDVADTADYIRMRKQLA